MNQENFRSLVSEVFKKFMDTFFKYEFEKYILVESQKEKNFDNVIFISMFGNIEGGFILEVDNPTVEKFLFHIQDNLKQKMDLAELVKGYIGEFGNILASRIVTNMGKSFGSTFLSTPSLFSGTGMKVDLFYDENFDATLDTDFGLFQISFSVKP